MARILMVDDDPDAVRLVTQRLAHAGHKVHGASKGADALAFVAAKTTPDIVVLDVDMPDMNGLVLLERLRAQTASPELPAIFLSGKSRPDDIAAGRGLGAVYLTKPFVANALLSAIDAIVDAEEQRRAAQAAADTEW